MKELPASPVTREKIIIIGITRTVRANQTPTWTKMEIRLQEDRSNLIFCPMIQMYRMIQIQ